MHTSLPQADLSKLTNYENDELPRLVMETVKKSLCEEYKNSDAAMVSDAVSIFSSSVSYSESYVDLKFGKITSKEMEDATRRFVTDLERCKVGEHERSLRMVRLRQLADAEIESYMGVGR